MGIGLGKVQAFALAGFEFEQARAALWEATLRGFVSFGGLESLDCCFPVELVELLD